MSVTIIPNECGSPEACTTFPDVESEAFIVLDRSPPCPVRTHRSSGQRRSSSGLRGPPGKLGGWTYGRWSAGTES
jgi:hypothetical protein